MKKFSGYSIAAAVLAAATLAGCPQPRELHTQVLKSPNSIDGKQLYFIPSDTEKRGGDKFYQRVVTKTDLSELPVNPTGHRPVAFGEGTTFQVDLGDDGVFFYGEYYRYIVIGANGTVAFGGLDGAVEEPSSIPGGDNSDVAEHFKAPQISLLPVNAKLDGGTVSYEIFADSVVVTFANITIEETTDNAFQLELFKQRGRDGDLVLNYPQVTNLATGVVGLSNGELADASEEEIEAFVGRFRSSNFNENSDNTEVVPAS